VCGWRSQCQFSHCLEWPRRQPRRYNYSPEICPSISIIESAEGGTDRIENNCSAGQRCQYAHSKEEVLFHPHLFKTILCEEHTNNNVGAKQTRNAKKNRCHRYYCPFAHGPEELRSSVLQPEDRDRLIAAHVAFPSDPCCSVCTRHWVTPSLNPDAPKFPTAAEQAALAAAFGEQGPPLPWAPNLQNGTQPPIGLNPNLWDVLSTVPNLNGLTTQGDLVLKPSKDNSATAKNHTPTLSPIQKPTGDPFAVPYKPIGALNHSLFYGEPLASLRVSKLSNDSPAFIDLTSAGYSSGLTESSTKSSTKSTKTNNGNDRDLLGEFYYAML
jgi:hypothetical protein